jgi:DNA-binding NarL/FixJ family response regulator
VDDQRSSRAALRAALARRRDLTVAGESPTGEASAEAARVSQADVAVVNVTVAPERVAACLTPLLRAQPRLRVLVVSLPDPAALSATALAAGAAECLVRKPAPPDKHAVLRAAERLAAAPSPPAPPVAAMAASPARAMPLLSRREQQVLELLARGHTRREIAEQLGIGVKSIETYRSRLAHKLGAHTRAELVRYALETGLLRTSA